MIEVGAADVAIQMVESISSDVKLIIASLDTVGPSARSSLVRQMERQQKSNVLYTSSTPEKNAPRRVSGSEKIPVLTKPFSLTELIGSVSEVLRH